MDYQSAYAISAAGMDMERLRVDVAAMNLAYANTPLPLRGAGYQPLRVVSAGTARAQSASFDDILDDGLSALGQASVQSYRAQPRQVYEPGHPQANRNGYVLYPGVDTLLEMVTLMTATRSYEANVAAFNAARTMATRALDIGAQS